MGYSTDFSGSFELDQPLEPQHSAYLKAFMGTRRMARKADVAATLPDPVREAAGLPIGEQGAYFVGGLDFMGQGHDDSIIDYNNPPKGQPGLWCQWEPMEDDTCIGWNGGEKFYAYIPWLEYIIEHFLKPWGYTISGDVEWSGEDFDDRGVIVVENNRVGVRAFAPTEVQWRDDDAS